MRQQGGQQDLSGRIDTGALDGRNLVLAESLANDIKAACQ
jgi:hypothetical protein